MARSRGGKSIKGGHRVVYGPASLRTATFESRRASASITAFKKSIREIISLTIILATKLINYNLTRCPYWKICNIIFIYTRLIKDLFKSGPYTTCHIWSCQCFMWGNDTIYCICRLCGLQDNGIRVRSCNIEAWDTAFVRKWGRKLSTNLQHLYRSYILPPSQWTQLQKSKRKDPWYPQRSTIVLNQIIELMRI